uniref:Ubiquinone biosynthesis protein COQ4 homolog, mitochondrial n=1 Tax=Aceria tosichella TaxID=561515 RepID=A0A6G1S8P0_9ACAR
MIATRLLIRHMSTSAATGNKLYEQHIPLTNLQKLLLSIGSGVTAIVDPYRHDLVADFGETTGHLALKWMHERMLADEEGRRILSEKPRLRSDTVDYERLKSLPENTFGYHYSRFYTDNRVSPDTRRQVQFVDDAELAFVMQRYRELHDVFHTILNQPTTIKGEFTVKAFEAVQTRLPLCILGGLLGPLKLRNRDCIEYITKDLPWALKCGKGSKFLMNVYFEERFDQDIEKLRSELKIELNK